MNGLTIGSLFSGIDGSTRNTSRLVRESGTAGLTCIELADLLDIAYATAYRRLRNEVKHGRIVKATERRENIAGNPVDMRIYRINETRTP